MYKKSNTEKARKIEKEKNVPPIEGEVGKHVIPVRTSVMDLGVIGIAVGFSLFSGNVADTVGGKTFCKRDR